jgi:hypothetical protein
MACCAIVLGIALFAAYSVVRATTFSSSSFGCGFSGGSAGGTPTNYSWTSTTSCALAAGVQVDYLYNGSWLQDSWVWSGSLYAQDGQPFPLSSTHQIYVFGSGYGQYEYSSY